MYYVLHWFIWLNFGFEWHIFHCRGLLGLANGKKWAGHDISLSNMRFAKTKMKSSGSNLHASFCKLRCILLSAGLKHDLLMNFQVWVQTWVDQIQAWTGALQDNFHVLTWVNFAWYTVWQFLKYRMRTLIYWLWTSWIRVYWITNPGELRNSISIMLVLSVLKTLETSQA